MGDGMSDWSTVSMVLGKPLGFHLMHTGTSWIFVGDVPAIATVPQVGGTPQIPPARRSRSFPTRFEALDWVRTNGLELTNYDEREMFFPAYPSEAIDSRARPDYVEYQRMMQARYPFLEEYIALSMRVSPNDETQVHEAEICIILPEDYADEHGCDWEFIRQFLLRTRPKKWNETAVFTYVD